jgi:hypothetical protein
MAIMNVYSHPSPGRKMKKPFRKWAAIDATTMTAMIPDAARRERADRYPESGGDLGGRGEWRREAPRAHPDALEPPGRTRQTTLELVVAVSHEGDTDGESQQEQDEIGLGHG